MLAFASSVTDEFEAALAEASKGIPIETQTSSFGDPVSADYKDVLRMLPPEKKEKLAAQIAQLTPRLAQERFAQPIPRGIGPALGILILRDIGTDEQKINAFRNLDLYGNLLSEACAALATCEGPEGVRILKQYAESQFLGIELGFAGSKSDVDPEKHAGQNPPSGKFLQTLMALQGAYHSDGPAAADKLAARFTSVANDFLTDRDRAEFREEMEKARHRRENLIREKRPNNKRNPKPASIDMETSGAGSETSSQAISSKMWFWLGVSIAAVFLGLACWNLFRRR